jgi:hypothetical protein
VSSCAVSGCPRTITTVVRVGIATRPTGTETYRLTPIDVALCPDHGNILSPAAEMYFYSMEWDGMST